MDFGSEQRVSVPLRSRPKDEITKKFRIGPVAFGQASRSQSLRGLPSSVVQLLRLLQYLRCLEDVFVRNKVIEQRIAPVIFRIEDLSGQFLNDILDGSNVYRLGNGAEDASKPSHPV